MNFPNSSECENAIYKLKSKTSKNYHKQFSNEGLDKTLHSQQELLKSCILSNGKQRFFNVFNMGCASGKTYVAVNSMPYYLYNASIGAIPKKGVLFVIRQTDECDRYANDLNYLFKDEDIGNYKEVALSFHSKKYTTEDGYIDEEERKKLLGQVEHHPIVFITHENYTNLAEDKKARATFSKGRRLLIIDESIDICEIVEARKIKGQNKGDSICLEEIEEIGRKLQDEDKIVFKDLIYPLLLKIIQIGEEKEEITNRAYNFKMKHKQYNEDIKYFTKSVIPKYEGQTKRDLKKILKIVGLIYNDTCLINKRLDEDEKKEQISIKTINRAKKMWTLENNIILDASATLEPKYKLNKELYFMMNNEPTLDYSKWHIEYILANSTKYAKGIGRKKRDTKQKIRYRSFLCGCSQIIMDLGINDTLVVCHKDEHIQVNKLNNEEIYINPFGVNVPIQNIVHFGDITGKRGYGNIKNVLITHTPNYSDTDYILQHMYYKNLRYADDKTFAYTSIRELGYTHMFINQELQEFKEETIANHMYQAVCRVNREMEHETTIVIISQYIGSVLYVRDMLKCECIPNTDYDAYFEIGKNNLNEEREEKSKNKKLENLFVDILNGNITNYGIEYAEINTPKIIRVKKDDIKNILKFDNNKFDKAKSKISKFINNNTIICAREFIYFVLDTQQEVGY